MTIFDDYTLADAKKIIGSRASARSEINLAYYNGDHWQNKSGWTGPSPQQADVGYTATMTQIEKAFVSRNAVAEIVDRHTGGVLGRELQWKFNLKRPLGKVSAVDPETGAETTEDEQPTDEEQALITEAEYALTTWWDKQKALGKFQDMVRMALLAKRAVLRLYVPPGVRNENMVPKGTLEESLGRIWFQHLGTDEDTLDLRLSTATVYTDKLTKRDIGLYAYREAPKEPSGSEGAELAELSYVDTGTGNTVLRIVGNDGNMEEPVSLPLDGRLTLYEMVRKPLVGPQIVSQQKLLNLSETMKQRNVVLGGFLERVLLNAQLPGRWTKDESGVDRFIPDPLYTGAGTTNALQGIPYTDKDGNQQITTPNIVYRDPVPVTTFSDTSNSAYLAILQEAQQLHYALAGDAVVSSASRVQAQAAFQKDLLLTASEVEAAVRWLLETALAMASHFSGMPGRYSGLRAVVQARIDAGPVTPDEKRLAIDLKDAGLWSAETAMSATGVEDVDAEKERIEREQQEQQVVDTQRMAAVQQAVARMGTTQINAVPNGETENSAQEDDSL